MAGKFLQIICIALFALASCSPAPSENGQSAQVAPAATPIPPVIAPTSDSLTLAYPADQTDDSAGYLPPENGQIESATPAPTGAEPLDASENETSSEESDASTEADADVIQVRAVEASDGSWTFHVTVAHPDTGWEDYADGWDVVTPAGEVIKKSEEDPFTRLLLHPHENEQPFTRSQNGLFLPEGTTQVSVRAHDLVYGWGGKEVTVYLTQDEGEGFKVERAD